MPLEMPFEMRNLTSFQMEKLCYDLKLEVLMEMDVDDTIELVKVNAGFQWMLSREPSLVFGNHVDTIGWFDERILLGKFPGSSSLRFGAIHLPLSKRIHSCDKLELHYSQKRSSDEFKAILNQLNSVKHLVIYARRWNDEDWLEFFENFPAMIEESAIFRSPGWFEENQVGKLFENFVAHQAYDCKRFVFECSSVATLHFYYDAFAKTSIKFFKLLTAPRDFEEIVQSIVRKQIPSKNLKAALVVSTSEQKIYFRILVFLSNFPGMEPLDEENDQEVIKIADELLRKHAKGDADITSEDFPAEFFRRNIDSTRDCVYILQVHYTGLHAKFFALYVQPQSEMMKF